MISNADPISLLLALDRTGQEQEAPTCAVCEKKVKPLSGVSTTAAGRQVWICSFWCLAKFEVPAEV